MSAVPSADERYSLETDGFLVVASFLDSEHVARLREALRRAIARRRELERRGTPHFARPGFHNALWHTRGPSTRADGRRIMLYYAYEHPWMIGSPEHTAYPREFYDGLSGTRRKLFHDFLFRP